MALYTNIIAHLSEESGCQIMDLIVSDGREAAFSTCKTEHVQLKKRLRSQIKERLSMAVRDLMENISDDMWNSPWKRIFNAAYCMPLKEHGFSLHKRAFHDALALRYGWTPDRLPSKCE